MTGSQSAALVGTPFQREAQLTLAALVKLASGELSGLAKRFLELAARAGERGDLVTEFALMLWAATVERRSGHSEAAARRARVAATRGQGQGFRLSPNWWTTDLAGLGADGTATVGEPAFLSSCSFPWPIPPAIAIDSDSRIIVAGVSLPDQAWRRGRSGPRVLRRLFDLIAAQYPAPAARDDLCDALWPDSDGDRPAVNLHSALNDLRKVLADTPGLDIRSEESGYSLVAAENVTVASRAQRRSDRRPSSALSEQPR